MTLEMSVKMPEAATYTIWEEASENPLNWSTRRRWMITIIICVLSVLCTAGSSIFTPGVELLALHFQVKLVAATLALSLYVLGWAFGPLIFAPMSEVYGRNIVYRTTWLAYFLINLGPPLTESFAGLLICRFIAGFTSGATITLCAGTATDLWRKEEIGPPFAFIAMSAYLGPVFGPLVGGYLTQYVSFRWPFWFMFISTGIVGTVFFWIPETYAPTLKARLANKQSSFEEGSPAGFQPPAKSSKGHLLRKSIFRPLQLLFLEPVVFFMCLYLSFVIAILNLYFAAYPIIFQGVYRMGQGNASLAFLGIGVGVFLATASAKFQNKLYIKLTKKHAGTFYPEARLPYTIAAAVLIPASIFWFAWTAVPGTHWMAPIASGVPFGWALLTVVMNIMAYLTDTYRDYSASVTASLTLLRSLLAMAFPLFAPNMYNNLGHEWASSLIGFLALLLMPIPLLFYKFGPLLRSKSKYTFKE